MLQTITVEDSTLVLLKTLQQISLFKDLRLVGGTALALQLGHRHSIDLDLFGVLDENVDAYQMADAIQEQGFEVSIESDARNIKMLHVNGVKVDIVNFPLAWLETPIETEGVRMAGLKDIAAMKLQAISGRGKKKDFIDLYFLLQHLSLEVMFKLFEKKYPRNYLFNVIRSLTYFADAEEDAMPKMFIDIDWEHVKSTIRKAIKKLNE
jgi:predicted nucleotidyltransferase component of viral defense system